MAQELPAPIEEPLPPGGDRPDVAARAAFVGLLLLAAALAYGIAAGIAGLPRPASTEPSAPTRPPPPPAAPMRLPASPPAPLTPSPSPSPAPTPGASPSPPAPAAPLGPPEPPPDPRENPCGLNERRLEGECFLTGPRACNPDRDGESMERLSGANFSGGLVATAPHGGCWWDFGNVTFPDPWTPTAFRGYVADAGTGAVARFSIMADGENVGWVDANATFRIYPIIGGYTLRAGVHEIRVHYTVLHGPEWVNARFDSFDGVLGAAS